MLDPTNILGSIFVIASLVFLALRLMAISSRARSHYSAAGRSLLLWWAGTEGWTVLKAELMVGGGPWKWRRTDEPVFRISVCDESGKTSAGWARCRGLSFGLRKQSVDVVWDDLSEKASETAPGSAGTRNTLWDDDMDGSPGRA